MTSKQKIMCGHKAWLLLLLFDVTPFQHMEITCPSILYPLRLTFKISKRNKKHRTLLIVLNMGILNIYASTYIQELCMLEFPHEM